MKTNKMMKLMSILVAASVLTLTACSNASNEAATAETTTETTAAAETTTETPAETAEPAAPATVEVTDIHGTVEVPVNPETVVALDNRTFETLSDWGIELAAAPKGVMPGDSPYVANESVQDIGNHREPNLELLASVDPDVVIVGQRFAGFYEDIKKLVPNAAVVDFSFDVSEESATPGDNLVNGLKDSTTSLGQIFDKTAEAEALNASFDESIAQAKAAYNGTDTVMSVVVSAGEIGFSAPHSGRVWGPMYEIFGWVPALEVDASSSDHQGDDISVEAIAQSNPDWIFVLDRDAAIADDSSESVPAQDVIDQAPALKNTTAITEQHVIYAPNDTYTNESIQTYIELFNNLSASLTES